jgi:hypothetical protein
MQARIQAAGQFWENVSESQEEWLLAVVALVVPAVSRGYRDRAIAVRALASFAEVPVVRKMLPELVLNAGDIFVIRDGRSLVPSLRLSTGGVLRHGYRGFGRRC